MEEKINEIVKWMEAGRSDVVTALAGDFFIKNGQIDTEAKKLFEEKTGFKVFAGKTMGMLGGYILAESEKWYFA